MVHRDDRHISYPSRRSCWLTTRSRGGGSGVAVAVAAAALALMAPVASRATEGVGTATFVRAQQADGAVVEGKLTVRTQIGLDAQSRIIRLLVLGEPPTLPVQLVNSTGDHVVMASVLPDEADCAEEPALSTGRGSDVWCLSLDDVAAGAAVSGNLEGERAKLALTVESRHGLLLPSLTALSGLALAVLVTLASPSCCPGSPLGWGCADRPGRTTAYSASSIG